MKKILAIIVAACTVFALAACGGDSGTAATTAAAGGSGDTATTAASGGSSAGETYDTGVFSVTIPSGWKAFPTSDMFEEADENGDYPVDPTSLNICKGGEEELDILLKPTVSVTYYDDFSAEDQIDTCEIWYDEIEEIDVTVNGTKCPSIEAKMEALTEGEYYTYDLIFIPVTDSSCIQVLVPVDIDGEGVNRDDADVQTIINSVKLD